MIVNWQFLGFGVLSGLVGLFVLKLVAGSLRTGINDWTRFGPVKRAPYEFDFWVVNALFGGGACVFVLGSVLFIYRAFP